MLKKYRCPNRECDMYNHMFPVMVKVDGWFYQFTEWRCIRCDHTAEEVEDD